jgi:hypothetical protein
VAAVAVPPDAAAEVLPRAADGSPLAAAEPDAQRVVVVAEPDAPQAAQPTEAVYSR